jgi:spoIIIJ-associated protein
MSSQKRDFFAKEVTDAIKKACDSFKVAQDELDIDIIETGSTGIFGLIRKKAYIRASVKGPELDDEPEVEEVPVEVVEEVQVEETVKKEIVTEEKAENEAAPSKPEKKKSPRQSKPPRVTEPIQEESVEIVRQELSEVLVLMGFESVITAEVDGSTIRCKVNDEHEEALSAQEGKIIDSLQYLLRKLAARKVEEKIRLSIDIGSFREKRKAELIERAKELADLVKEDGKTQAIPPLNPSERRIVHVALQDDNDIRSRSVGGGLFKKILIYKPGKGKKPGGNKRGGRGKGKGGGNSKPQEKKKTSDD